MGFVSELLKSRKAVRTAREAAKAGLAEAGFAEKALHSVKHGAERVYTYSFKLPYAMLGDALSYTGKGVSYVAAAPFRGTKYLWNTVKNPKANPAGRIASGAALLGGSAAAVAGASAVISNKSGEREIPPEMIEMQEQLNANQQMLEDMAKVQQTANQYQYLAGASGLPIVGAATVDGATTAAIAAGNSPIYGNIQQVPDTLVAPEELTTGTPQAQNINQHQPSTQINSAMADGRVFTPQQVQAAMS